MPTKRKLIVVAPTKEAGEKRYPTATVIVTPKSRDGARGLSGAKVIVMNSMRDHEDLEEILAAVQPATIEPLGRSTQIETMQNLAPKSEDEEGAEDE